MKNTSIPPKLFLFYLLLGNIILFTACQNRFEDIKLKTETEIIVPAAHAVYTLGDLFYGLDDSDSTDLSLNNGIFYSLSDTLKLESSSFNFECEELDVIFRTTNIMPFQVDLELFPFDTLTNSITGDRLFVTMVEAAPFNDKELNLSNAVQGDQHLILNSDELNVLQNSNGFLVKASFVWPYEDVSTTIVADFYNFYAFELKVLLHIKI